MTYAEPSARHRRARHLFFSLAFLVSMATVLETAHAEEFLTRSIYLPVEFELCEHLNEGVLYQGEQILGVVPAKRIFQFTYYPKLARIEPQRTDVRVEGVRDNGELFVGRLAVTPGGIYSANEKIELDLNKQLARLKYKLDVRYKPYHLKLRCSDTCGRNTSVTADALLPKHDESR